MRSLAGMDSRQRAVAVVEQVKALPADNVVDADFAEVAVTGRPGAPGPARTSSVEELKEMLIAETFEALQHELLSREAEVRGARGLLAVKANVVEALEWAMLGTAYAVDAVTSRTAIGTFLPGNASWLYGLSVPC
jgi:hypothetical protein